MPRFYQNIPAGADEVQALTSAITCAVIDEMGMHKDFSSRIYGAVETAILNELSKDQN
jgi:hypothetical protein